MVQLSVPVLVRVQEQVQELRYLAAREAEKVSVVKLHTNILSDMANNV